MDGNPGDGVNEMDPVLANGNISHRAPDHPGGITMGIGSTRWDSRWASDQPPGITGANLQRRGLPLLNGSTSRTAFSIQASRILHPHLGREKLG